MFNTFKNFFGITAQVEPKFNTNIKKEDRMFARITDNNELFSATGELIGSYSRRRDAVRGAARRGLKLAA